MQRPRTGALRALATTTTIVLLFVLTLVGLARRRGGVAVGRRERKLYYLPVWQRALAFVLMPAFLLAATPVHAEVLPASHYFFYYHTDHLGSSNVTTDRDGQVRQHYEYKAFGGERFAQNDAGLALTHRYTGQALDEETGLYYYGARYYDPELGRFTQADTIVPSPTDAQTLNRYAYCGNNPIKYVDPSGHEFITALVVGVIIGAAVGAASAAATGGDIGMGALTGAIGGLFGGLGSAAGGALGAIAAGAAAGAVNAAITGGNIGIGALSGAIGAGIGFAVGGVSNPQNWKQDIAGFAIASGVGAVSGGISSVLAGGSFEEGAANGAIGGAIGYGIAIDLPSAWANSHGENPRFHLFASLLTDPLTYLTALAGLGDAVAFGAPTYLAKKIYGDDENAALIEQATQTGSYKSAAVGGMLIGGVQNVAAKGVVVVEKAGAKAFVKIARNPAVAERMANKWLGKGVHRFLTDRKTSEIRGLINDKTGKFVRFPHIDSGTPMLHWNFEGAGKNIHVIINP